MVNIPGAVGRDIAVDVIVSIEEKYVDIPPRNALGRFPPRNLLAGIFDNARVFLDELGGEDAFARNA